MASKDLGRENLSMSIDRKSLRVRGRLEASSKPGRGGRSAAFIGARPPVDGFAAASAASRRHLLHERFTGSAGVGCGQFSRLVVFHTKIV